MNGRLSLFLNPHTPYLSYFSELLMSYQLVRKISPSTYQGLRSVFPIALRRQKKAWDSFISSTFNWRGPIVIFCFVLIYVKCESNSVVCNRFKWRTKVSKVCQAQAGACISLISSEWVFSYQKISIAKVFFAFGRWDGIQRLSWSRATKQIQLPSRSE